MHIGVIEELWRYPVKSMKGERLALADITVNGVAGDRLYGVRDRASGRILSAKRMAALFHCRARYREDELEVELPDGTRLLSSSDLTARLSESLGREVVLARASDEERALIEIAESSATDEGPSNEFSAPAGTFFDSAPLHLMTTASLRRIRELDPGTTYDVRRFRPNVVIKTSPELRGFIEAEWVDRHLAIGDSVRVSVERPCGRCVMTTHAQDELGRERDVLRTVARVNDNKFGVLARVVASGPASVGDRVTLEAPRRSV